MPAAIICGVSIVLMALMAWIFIHTHNGKGE